MKSKNKRRKELLVAYALILPAFIVVMLIVAYPIITSVIRSFTDGQNGGFTFDNYLYFFQKETELANILFTLKVVIITVILATIISYALALYLRFVKSKVSTLMGALYLIPRFVPGLVAVYAVIIVVRDTGVLNRISMFFGGNFKPGMMYSEKGLIFMNLWFNIPFAALIITSALSTIPDSIIEGARDVGASRWKVFTSMILPLSIKDVLVAATFVFMGNVGSFTTPFLLMGATHPKMLGLALYDQFNKYRDFEKTAALSIIMFLICSVSAVVYIYTNLKEQKWER